ncbi:MAG: hypothetical protein WBJ07_00255, partial [Limnochordia bacterium]
IGVPQTYDYLDKMQDRIIRFIVDNSRVSEAQLREMMFRTGELVRDVGTVLIGEEAVNCGLINEIGGLGAAIARLKMFIENPGFSKQRRFPYQPASMPNYPPNYRQMPQSFGGYQPGGGY